MMNSDRLAQIQAHAKAIAALLYEETQAISPEQLETLEGIEVTVRRQLLDIVSPEIALFLSKAAVRPLQGEAEG